MTQPTALVVVGPSSTTHAPHMHDGDLHAGPLLARAVSPVTVVLAPPNTLVLEVEARAFAAITWLINGTAMHDFPRLSLEMFSKRLLLVNTTTEDAGVYEADVYPIGGSPPMVVQFTVLPPSMASEYHHDTVLWTPYLPLSSPDSDCMASGYRAQHSPA